MGVCARATGDPSQIHIIVHWAAGVPAPQSTAFGELVTIVLDDDGSICPGDHVRSCCIPGWCFAFSFGGPAKVSIRSADSGEFSLFLRTAPTRSLTRSPSHSLTRSHLRALPIQPWWLPTTPTRFCGEMTIIIVRTIVAVMVIIMTIDGREMW